MSLLFGSTAFDSSFAFRTHRFLALTVCIAVVVVVLRLFRVFAAVVVVVDAGAVVEALLADDIVGVPVVTAGVVVLVATSLGAAGFLHFLQMKSSSGFTWLLIRPTHNMWNHSLQPPSH